MDEFRSELRRISRYLSEQAQYTPQASEALDLASNVVSEVLKWWDKKRDNPPTAQEFAA